MNGSSVHMHIFWQVLDEVIQGGDKETAGASENEVEMGTSEVSRCSYE